jgi:hypothetical protein
MNTFRSRQAPVFSCSDGTEIKAGSDCRFIEITQNDKTYKVFASTMLACVVDNNDKDCPQIGGRGVAGTDKPYVLIKAHEATCDTKANKPLFISVFPESGESIDELESRINSFVCSCCQSGNDNWLGVLSSPPAEGQAGQWYTDALTGQSVEFVLNRWLGEAFDIPMNVEVAEGETTLLDEQNVEVNGILSNSDSAALTPVSGYPMPFDATITLMSFFKRQNTDGEATLVVYTGTVNGGSVNNVVDILAGAGNVETKRDFFVEAPADVVDLDSGEIVTARVNVVPAEEQISMNGFVRYRRRFS